jgi:hypothetical protein
LEVTSRRDRLEIKILIRGTEDDNVLQVVTSDLTEYPLQGLPGKYSEEFVVKSSIKKNTSKL